MNGAMAERITQLDSACQICLFDISEAKLMLVDECVMRGIEIGNLEIWEMLLRVNTESMVP